MRVCGGAVPPTAWEDGDKERVYGGAGEVRAWRACGGVGEGEKAVGTHIHVHCMYMCISTHIVS